MAASLNRTPFIILVRPGNPLNIQDFADLTRPGVGVVHPDPLTSGGAQWALLAEYHSVRMLGGRSAAGLRPVARHLAERRGAGGLGPRRAHPVRERLWRCAHYLRAGSPQRPLARPAQRRDRLPAKHHLERAYRRGAGAQHRAGERDLVEAFVAFLWSDEAQRIYVEYGFRSVDEALNSLPTPISA
jgi:sulfate/thiosulfate transport system substrate-binding protein